MNKKFTSAVLAGAMAISALSVSAFAAETTQNVKAGGETTLKATAGFAPVAIDVVLPSSITAAINPYKIDYKFDNTAAGTAGVISPVYEIENKTADYGVKVAAKVWASLEKGSKVSIATVDKETKAAPVFKNDNTEDKQVFAYLNTTVADDKKFANDTYDAADETQVLFTEDQPDNAVKLMEIGKGGKKGYFQIQGDCVEEPEEKWTAADTVDLNIIFDINPFNEDSSSSGGTELTASGATMTGTGGTYAIALTTANAGNVITLTAPTGKTITNITDTNTRNTVNVTAGTVTIDSGIRAGDNGTITVTYDDSSTATITVTVS